SGNRRLAPSDENGSITSLFARFRRHERLLQLRLLRLRHALEAMRNWRSVGGNQSLRREIFDIRRAADFSSTVSLYRPLLGLPSPACRILGRESRYPPAQSICNQRNKCR